jgi:hypothetical protein
MLRVEGLPLLPASASLLAPLTRSCAWSELALPPESPRHPHPPLPFVVVVKRLRPDVEHLRLVEFGRH